jgi:hypothetical protein
MELLKHCIKIYTEITVPTAVAQAVTIVNCIREVPVSNLGPNADSPHGFRGLPQSLRANVGILL